MRKEGKELSLVFALFTVLCALLCAAFWGVVYVALHFLGKVW